VYYSKGGKILTSSREDLLISLSTLAREDSDKKKELEKTLGEYENWLEFTKNEVSLSVYYHLKKLSLLNSIPPPINRKLENLFLSNTAHNIIHLENLARLVQKLSQQKIPLMILKGAALCDTVYPHIGLRTFCDLDILIHKKDIQKVMGVLTQLDYSISHTHAQHHFSAYQKSNHSLPLEVHWDLVNEASPFQKYAFQLCLEKFWQDAMSFEFRKTEALWLSPEHQLIYLCIHMLKEGYSHRKWLVDLYYLLQFFRGGIDWNKLLEECEQYQVKRPLYYALSALDEIFHISEMNGDLLSQETLDKLKPAKIAWLERKILARLKKNKPLNSYFYRFFLYQFSIERVKDKWKALLSLMKYAFQLSFLKSK
jgi:hypothetical protein